MKVFVLGGTGAIGRCAVRALVASGHTVSALARSREGADRLKSQGATAVRLSLFDTIALGNAFQGFDAVVNLATAIPPTAKFMHRAAWEQNDRIRTEGSAAIADAALEAGVPRVVQESVIVLYRDGGETWIDEHWPTDNYALVASCHAAEASARRFSDAGGVGVVLRFGSLYGPGAAHSEETLALARRGIGIMAGPSQAYQSSIYVEDAGAAVVAALNVSAGVYNVVDDEPLTKRGYADATATAIGRRPWLRAPGRLAVLLGANSTALTRSLRVSNSKLRNASGWNPRFRSANEGLQEMAAVTSFANV